VKLPFEARLLIDPTAGVKFVAFYIPFNARSVEECMGLADNIDVAGGLNLFHIEARGPGTEPTLSKNYKFSGRIYVYHEDLYSPEQSGEIHKYYADRHLLVELRGPEYVELEALRRLAKH
jgi:hypothetical protein